MDLSSGSGNNDKHGVIAAGLLFMLLAATNSFAQINKCNINGKTIYIHRDTHFPLDARHPPGVGCREPG